MLGIIMCPSPAPAVQENANQANVANEAGKRGGFWVWVSNLADGRWHAGHARWADSRRLFALINCQCLGIISTHLSAEQCWSGCHRVLQESRICSRTTAGAVGEGGECREGKETAGNERRQDEMQNVMMQLH